MNSLGFDKTPAETRVVVAMSGGVDSSVTAALLAREGYDVVGITLQLYDHGAAVGRKGACCAGQDIYDARRVADALGIAHYVLDYETRFQAAVMEDFADSYLRGETPIPCVRCNQRVKFADLLATARELGADALATGHYAVRRAGPGGPELHRAADAERDQSYFLFATTRDQLDFLRFPLGGRRKAEIRALAAELGGIGVTGSNRSNADLKRLVDRTLDKWGRIDVLVNSAGHGPRAPVLALTDEDWHTGMEVYLLSAIRPTRLVTPVMQQQKAGAIINISSFAAFEPDPVFPTSGVFRSGLAAFAKLFADQYAADNIRMNNVLPGFIDSLPEKEEFRARIPMQRYGQVREIADTIAFLASDGGGYITGQNIRVDGGITRSV